jgi:hypothetical protein
MPCHCWSSIGEESPIREDADRCPPPRQDGRRVCRVLGGGVLYHGVHTWALTRQNLLGVSCGRVDSQILEARRVTFTL